MEILKLKVELENVKDVISKVIKVNSNIKLSTFVYTVLASMNAIKADNYKLKINNEILIEDNKSNILKEKILKEINLTKKDNIEIEYGKNKDFIFKVILLEKENIKKSNEDYPKIISENGYGILEDIMDTNMLNKIIEEQNVEYNKYGYTFGYKYFKDNIKQDDIETYVYNIPYYKNFEEKYNVLKNITSFLELRYLDKMEEKNEKNN